MKSRKDSSRLLPPYLAVVLGLVLLSGCATGPDGEPPLASGRPAEEEIPGSYSAFSTANIVRSGGLQIAFPPEWSVAIVGNNHIYGTSPDRSVLTNVTSFLTGERSGLENFPRERRSTVRVAGEEVTVARFGENRNSPPRLFVWERRPRPLYVEVLSTEAAAEAVTGDLAGIVSSVRSDPYLESARLIEGLYVFRGYGSGWEFVRDIEEGGVFGWFPRTPTGIDGWDIDPRMLIVLRKGVPIRRIAEQRSSRDDPREYTFTVRAAGPIMYGVHRHRVSRNEAGTLIEIDPVQARPEAWHMAILTDHQAYERLQEPGGIWKDERITTFFSSCFAPAP